MPPRSLFLCPVCSKVRCLYVLYVFVGGVYVCLLAYVFVCGNLSTCVHASGNPGWDRMSSLILSTLLGRLPPRTPQSLLPERLLVAVTTFQLPNPKPSNLYSNELLHQSSSPARQSDFNPIGLMDFDVVFLLTQFCGCVNYLKQVTMICSHVSLA